MRSWARGANVLRRFAGGEIEVKGGSRRPREDVDGWLDGTAGLEWREEAAASSHACRAAGSTGQADSADGEDLDEIGGGEGEDGAFPMLLEGAKSK